MAGLNTDCSQLITACWWIDRARSNADAEAKILYVTAFPFRTREERVAKKEGSATHDGSFTRASADAISRLARTRMIFLLAIEEMIITFFLLPITGSRGSSIIETISHWRVCPTALLCLESSRRSRFEFELNIFMLMNWKWLEWKVRRIYLSR